MSDINIRIETQEDELDRLIARIDEAILKRDILLQGPPIPTELRERAGEPPGAPAELGVRAPGEAAAPAELAEIEAQLATLRIAIQDAENALLQLYDKAGFEALLAPENIEATLARYVAEFEAAEARALLVEHRVDDVLLEVGGLDAILLQTQVVKAEVAAVEAEAMSLQVMLMDLNLPTVSRATRMILLRIPGLREVLRLMYQIKMLRHELLSPGPIGKVVALIVAAMYVMDAINKRQGELSAQMAELEADIDRRFITMEEALRGYAEVPERYRSTVPP